MKLEIGDSVRIIDNPDAGNNWQHAIGDIGEVTGLESTYAWVKMETGIGYYALGSDIEHVDQEESKPTETKGLRFNKGKPNPLFIPKIAHEIEEQAWEVGAAKYGWYNWEKGMKWSIPLACLRRHARALSEGEWTDAETGVSHVALIRCNSTMLAYYYYHDVGENDIPDRAFQKRALPIIEDTIKRLEEEYKDKRSTDDFPRMKVE